MGVMWRNTINKLQSGCIYSPPAQHSAIQRVEQSLALQLPRELNEFLRDSDGLADADGHKIIWSIEEILVENEAMRGMSQYQQVFMPFGHLLFFSGNTFSRFNPHLIEFGFAYGMPLIDDSYHGIFSWEQDDSRIRVATDLNDFLQSALAGELKEWWKPPH